STVFMQRFLRLAGFLGATAGTEEEQAKNFQWGLRRSTLNHLMCMSYTDVAQVANAARNYEILHERDDQDTEGVVIGTSRPLSRVVTGVTFWLSSVAFLGHIVSAEGITMDPAKYHPGKANVVADAMSRKSGLGKRESD
nr:zinc finger, CCHC-type, retrotransposon Gag domain protein [Tanacetum cinerariifolium]